MAIARLGVTVLDFYEMTPIEFHYALQIKAEMELEDMKSRMEAARFVGMQIWNSAGKSLKKTELDPKKLLPFAWDKTEVKRQTVEEMKNVMMGIMTRQNFKKS